MAHMKPLPAETTPELKADFDIFDRILGFVPNSLLTMQRRPKMVKGFGELTKGVMDPDGAVDLGLMRLIAHFSSRAAGCQYCEAHSLVAAKIHDVPQEKLAAIWDYQTSDLYTEAERAALDFAMAAGSVPNAVDAELFARMRQHWSEEQIVQILGAVCLYGFLNRWNDSMATDLEEAPRDMGDKVLARGGWTGGKHVQKTADRQERKARPRMEKPTL
jgi:alkylhydroperoxidase family enzyme